MRWKAVVLAVGVVLGSAVATGQGARPHVPPRAGRQTSNGSLRDVRPRADAGQAPAVDVAARPTAYQAFLAKLPTGNPQSILEARDELLTYLAGEQRCGSDTGCAEAVFDRFDAFYQRVIAACNQALYAEPAQRALSRLTGGERLEESAAAFERDLKAGRQKLQPDELVAVPQLLGYVRAGLAFTQGEGTWYLRDSPEFLIALAANLPPGEYREYVEFAAAESRERLAEDGGFQVPRDDLRKRLVRWDAFIRTHHTVARAKSMRHEADRLAACYLVGIDNTPAFEGYAQPRGGLNPELRESFARFLAANQDCSYYPLIAGFWKRLQASNFLLTESVVAYLEKEAASSEELSMWVRDLRRRFSQR